MKKVKIQFQRERKEIASWIEDGKSVASSIERLIKENKPLWIKLINSIYLTVAKDFVELGKSNIKKSKKSFYKEVEEIDTWKEIVSQWLKLNAAEKVKNILDTTKDELRKQLEEGTMEGESIDEIAGRIDNLYLEKIIPNRSVVIARTEVIGASNLGSRAGAKETGLPLIKEWLATMDKRTRDFHRSADGQQREMDEPYMVKGEKLMFPGDTSLGASGSNVIQCRCTETYEVKRK
jgi:hypothetical protein